jgi:hypothetical protein
MNRAITACGALVLGMLTPVPWQAGQAVRETAQSLKDQLQFEWIMQHTAGKMGGHVRDEAGNPIPNAAVHVLRYEFLQGRRQLTDLGEVRTGDDGAYQAKDLLPGFYYLLATHRVYPRTSQSYASQYYAGSADLAGATAVEIRPTETKDNLDFKLNRRPVFTVRGRLVNTATGSIAANTGLDIAIIPEVSGDWGESEIGFNHCCLTPFAGPEFEIPFVPPGRYGLLAKLYQLGKDPLMGWTRIEVGNADVNHVELDVGWRIDLQGQISVPLGPPPDLKALLVSPIRTGWGSLPVRVGGDGRFVLASLWAGPFTLVIPHLSGDLYLESARLGDVDLLGGRAELTPQLAPKPVEIVLGRGAHIEGIVLKDQKPFAGAMVGLAPELARRGEDRLYQQAVTDPQGRFALADIVPGRYRLFAWDTPYRHSYKLFGWDSPAKGYWADPHFLARCEAHGRPLTLEAGETKRLGLELIAYQTCPW